MMTPRIRLIALACALVLFASMSFAASSAEESLWDAAREGDLVAVKKLHKAGADLRARSKYGGTALSFACDKGHLDVVQYLVEQGVDIDSQDDFYNASPLGWTLLNEHFDVSVYLLEHGATGAGDALQTGVQNNRADLVSAALASSEITFDNVAAALTQATEVENSAEITKLLKAADVQPAKAVEVAPEVLETYVGQYRNEELVMTVDVRLEEGQLVAQANDRPARGLRALSESRFEAIGASDVKLSFSGRGGMIERVTLEQGSQTFVFPRIGVDVAPSADGDAVVVETEAEATASQEDATLEATTQPSVPRKVVRTAARNWPSFRGEGAAGVADGQGAPVEWDVETGKNIQWKTPIPGLANSSPIIWGDRIFVTTAISGAGDSTFRTGLYGDVDSVDDESEHQFKVYALDKANGKIVWERTAATRVPGAKRHLKATQANSTPVTDGKRVVALFGTIGMLACYDFDGKPKWTVDLGILDGGWFYDKTYQWGHASSPVIYKGLVIVQADIQENSFIAAYKLSNGKLAWKTARDEVPTWGSPTVYYGKDRDELITNGTTVRGYDPATGKELWSLGPNSEVTVATPIVANDLFYVTAGYPPVRPVYAIRPGANGDISLAEGTDSNDSIAWSLDRDGTYMPTPVAYGEYLYTCANNGRLTCYKAKSGERVYRARVGGGGTFTASPIAADGHLYFTDEDGDIIVIKAGGAYEEVGKHSMGEICMSTPAISDGLLVVRTLKHVFGIGETEF